MRARHVCLILSLLLASVAGAGIAAGGPGADVLQLRSAQVDVRPGPGRGLTELPPLAEREEAGQHRVLIRLDGPMTEGRRAALAHAGVGVLGYLSGNVFAVSLEEADPQRCADLGFVSWASEFRPAWKLDPSLGAREFIHPERRAIERSGRAQVIISLFPDAAPEPTRRFLQGPAEIHYSHRIAGSFEISATVPRALIPRLAELADVQYIEPRPELSDRSNLESSQIVQSGQLGLTPFYDAGLMGQGEIVGIIDSSAPGLRQDHCSFSDTEPIGPTHRKILAYNGSPGVRQHPTHVSATIAGHRADMFVNDTRGVAYEARLAYAPYPTFDEQSIYSALQLHHTQGARVHTNSWGDDFSLAARNLADCLDDGDLVTIAAVSARMMRLGEVSLLSLLNLTDDPYV